ncbi:NUDIX domain-containing protein [Alkalibaculum bacchi]|uniref:NUDIX domain-containing protein n=1 Tax=Alkalibaculum bacchi TaxID=645887 RepID=A0A366I0Y5_9FIRM|nr:NUDIX domain-containing protein [Alkalibaculum bacchi]RBP61043.1 NUDIX domain-containing protein [Alkalibaculum bacchi]
MKVRERASALLISSNNRIFLFKFKFSSMFENGKTLWITPGGGVKEGETYEATLRRELYEELGLEILIESKYVYARKKVFTDKKGIEFLSDERYFIVKVNNEIVIYENMTNNEKENTKAGKWWSLEEIQSSNEKFFVDGLDKILENILSNNIPSSPQEI